MRDVPFSAGGKAPHYPIDALRKAVSPVDDLYWRGFYVVDEFEVAAILGLCYAAAVKSFRGNGSPAESVPAPPGQDVEHHLASARFLGRVCFAAMGVTASLWNVVSPEIR